MRLILILVTLLVLGSSTGCTRYVPPIAHPLIDCVVAANRPAIEQLVTKWIEDAPAWSDVEVTAANAGTSIGGCARAEFVQWFLAPPAGTAVPPADQAIAARETLERYRNRYANNASFRTAHGDL